MSGKRCNLMLAGLVSIAREALRDEEDEAADFRRQLDRAALKSEW